MSAKAFFSKFLLCKPDQSGILSPKVVISNGTDQEGGTLKFNGAAVVDGAIKSAKILATTGHDVLFSAMSNVSDCVVDAKNLMIEGDFSGEITIQDEGILEIGDAAKVMGTVHTSGAVIIHAGADASELKVIKLPVKPRVEKSDSATSIIAGQYANWGAPSSSTALVAEAA